MRIVAAVGPLTAADRPGPQALRLLLLPREAKVAAQYARLRAPRAIVQKLLGSRVLCLRDLTRNNPLVDRAGQLTIVD